MSRRAWTVASSTLAVIAIILVLHGIHTRARPAERVLLEEMTWMEVRDAIKNGKTIAIVPTGGIEQNGPHLALGKHGRVVRETSKRIAEELGNALIAPVIEYVPEDDHMGFAGTISVPEGVLEDTLVAAARSLKTHGFRTICFLGDSGGNQPAQERAAARLNAEWGAEARAIHVSDYYGPGNGQSRLLEEQGETLEAIGTHAGIRDTSEMMATWRDGVREPKRRAAKPGADGVDGDPTRASRARGEAMLDLKVRAAVAQIRANQPAVAE